MGNFKDTVSLEKPPEELHYYTTEQFERFIDAAKSECKTVVDWGVSIAFLTGARKGEINALKWSDIDGNTLHIRRSMTQKLKGGDVETAPKNKSSIRDLQLPTPLMLVLNEHKMRRQEAAPNQFSENYRICGGEIPLLTSGTENMRIWLDYLTLRYMIIGTRTVRCSLMRGSTYKRLLAVSVTRMFKKLGVHIVTSIRVRKNGRSRFSIVYISTLTEAFS